MGFHSIDLRVDRNITHAAYIHLSQPTRHPPHSYHAHTKVMEFYEEAGILDPRFRTQNADYLMSEFLHVCAW
jgi:hypothetical protein